MKFGYKFSNLCGTVYKQGNVVYTSDGNSLISPVGNRVTVFDLVNHTSVTLPFECRSNIARISLSPGLNNLLLCVDVDGYAVLVNFHRRVVLARFNFKKPVRTIAFSSDSKYFAVGHGKNVQIWKTPGLHKEFSPFVLYRTFGGLYDDVTSLDFSPDSEFLVAGSRDLSCKVYTVHKVPGYVPITLAGHRDYIVGCFFSGQRTIYTVTRDGAVLTWKCEPADPSTVAAQLRIHSPQGNDDDDDDDESSDESSDDEADDDNSDNQVLAPLRSATRPFSTLSNAYGNWSLAEKKFFREDRTKVTAVAFHKASSLLSVGFSTGFFGLYDMPDMSNLHTLSIGSHAITTADINNTGEWLAFGSPALGQLLVWEWQSETYVLKQQGHLFDMTDLAFSPEGQYVATASDEGKVKLWNANSGFCFVTFEHSNTAPVTAVLFSPVSNAVFSAGLDGTVRAFDLVRYRNFRTFAAPDPVQFSSLAIDPSGDIVCAGTRDTYQIFVWSVQTGKLLEVLSGHEGPVSALSFHPTKSLLASTSWDKTAKLWDVFDSKGNTESFSHASVVLALSFRPDGKEFVTSSMRGTLHFWDSSEGLEIGNIDGLRDIAGGRKAGDSRSAVSNPDGKFFTSVAYTADGSCVIAGGNSKYVCIYHVGQRVLLKKFQITENRSIDGVLNFLNSKRMTDAGSLDLLDDEDDVELDYRGAEDYLPGAQHGNMVKRPQIGSANKKGAAAAKTTAVGFSPTGRMWAATSTEGLLVYSLDESMIFDPFDLDLECTPQNILATLEVERDYLKALVMSCRLNEEEYIGQCVLGTPADLVSFVAERLPTLYMGRVLAFLAKSLEKLPHVEYLMTWCLHLFTHHGDELKSSSSKYRGVFRSLQKCMKRLYGEVARTCDENKYTMEYLLQQANSDKKANHRFVIGGGSDSGDDAVNDDGAALVVSGKRKRSSEVEVEEVEEEEKETLEEVGDDEEEMVVTPVKKKGARKVGAATTPSRRNGGRNGSATVNGGKKEEKEEVEEEEEEKEEKEETPKRRRRTRSRTAKA